MHTLTITLFAVTIVTWLALFAADAQMDDLDKRVSRIEYVVFGNEPTP